MLGAQLRATKISVTPSAQHIQLSPVNPLGVLKFCIFHGNLSHQTDVIEPLFLEQYAMQGSSPFLPHVIPLPRVMALLPLKSYCVSQHVRLKTAFFIGNTPIAEAQRQH